MTMQSILQEAEPECTLSVWTMTGVGVLPAAASFYFPPGPALLMSVVPIVQPCLHFSPLVYGIYKSHFSSLWVSVKKSHRYETEILFCLFSEFSFLSFPSFTTLPFWVLIAIWGNYSSVAHNSFQIKNKEILLSVSGSYCFVLEKQELLNCSYTRVTVD